MNSPNEKNDANLEFAEDPDHVVDVEFASEVAPMKQFQTADTDLNLAGSRGAGIFGLVLAIISLFIWPGVLGPTAAVLGFVAWGRGSRGLGIWSIAIGLVSFLSYVLFLPMFA